jgi:hypothetical protein
MDFPMHFWLFCIYLKGKCHEMCFAVGFFYESSSPKPLKITYGSLKFFQNFEEIFASPGAPPVSKTPMGYLPPVSTTSVANLPPLSPTQVANLPPVSTTPAAILPLITLVL